MGDFGFDTAVEGSDGLYKGNLSSDWEIWGPNGGYVAAVALRAAGAHTRLRRPASFSGHYLSVGKFDEVDLTVVTLRRAKRAESMRVTMKQKGTPIFEAFVWSVDEGLGGLEHDKTMKPEVAPWSQLKSWEELFPERGTPFKFWQNIEGRPVHFYEDIDSRPLDPIAQTWSRFRPRSTFDDPYVDAGRYLLLIDTFIWPAATGAHRWPLEYMAPSLDINVQFHRAAPESAWLYCQAESPIAESGLIGGTATIWSEQGVMLASGGGHLLCRPVPAQV